jgi:tRNA threonylcarbamoyladenosine biosynthesis protein TsaB
VLVLALDAATYSGSVALIRDDTVIGQTVVAMRGKDEERLMPAVASVLSNHSLTPDRLDAVACGEGPGSFTSLRIAASIAKGICAARGIPLLVAPSTLLVAAALESLSAGSYVVALDAMRGDFFCQDVVVNADSSLEPGASWRASRDRVEEHAQSRGARIIGPAESPPALPHAAGFARLMTFHLARTVDLTTWEPNYGRKAEAQVRWETAHGRELGAG